MGRQKFAKQVKHDARRSGKQRNGSRQRDVQSFDGGDNIEQIGMAVGRDRTPLEARNEAQGHYICQLDAKELVFGSGPAGAGKTYIAAVKAADALLNKEIERIIVTRPVLQADEDLGFLPGDIAEKFAPYFRPVYEILRERLGASFLEYCLRPEIGKVVIAPFAYMRGCTFKNAFVILDEAQNVTVNQMKLFLTRIGDNHTVVINGDVAQCDLPKNVESGLADALRRFQVNEYVGHVEFTKDDCVRGNICRLALAAYE